MPFGDQEVADVGLGGICAMATRTNDQSLVAELGERHGVEYDPKLQEVSRKRRKMRAEHDAMEAIACFGEQYAVLHIMSLANACFRGTGYHPWFSHLLSLAEPSKTPSKREHYRQIFLPALTSKQFSEQERELDSILPDLPNPVSFSPLLQELRQNILAAKEQGHLVMLGEVGLDKSFRVPYPHHSQRQSADNGSIKQAEDDIATSGAEELASHTKQQFPKKVLTPFRPSMEHQLKLLKMQMEVAIELGVNVSLHSVQCQGIRPPCSLCFLYPSTQAH